MEALRSQSYARERYELIMIDNNSADLSAEIAREYPRVKLLSERRRGAYAARNRGLAEAAGALIAFTDADCAPAATWLERRAVRSSALVVTCTAADVARMRELYGGESRFEVIPNGFDEALRDLDRQRERERTRSALGLGPDQVAILFVGGPAQHNRDAVHFLERELRERIRRSGTCDGAVKDNQLSVARIHFVLTSGGNNGESGQSMARQRRHVSGNGARHRRARED